MWEHPALSRFLERLATMGRVICFDRRGTGISHPVPLGVDREGVQPRRSGLA